MKSDERPKVRPVKQHSIADKVFKTDFGFANRATTEIVHPLMVIADLKRGSLKSLDRYLAQRGGIEDREVAVELRKLISGSAMRTKYRILVVEHPDGPKRKVGRRTTKGRKPTRVELEVADAYEALIPFGKTAALAEVEKRLKLKPPTIRKYAKIVAEYRQRLADEAARDAERAEGLRAAKIRKEEVLRKLRANKS